MTYGLNTGAFVENGPAATSLELKSARTTARTWRALDSERRLRLVEGALKPANDFIDAYPVAL